MGGKGFHWGLAGWAAQRIPGIGEKDGQKESEQESERERSDK